MMYYNSNATTVSNTLHLTYLIVHRLHNVSRMYCTVIRPIWESGSVSLLGYYWIPVHILVVTCSWGLTHAESCGHCAKITVYRSDVMERDDKLLSYTVLHSLEVS